MERFLSPQFVQDTFDEIRSCFPRWDYRKQWRVRAGDDKECHGATGYCNSRQKTIFYWSRQVLMMSPVGVRGLLIHEICHHVASIWHDKTWATRMEQIAVKLEKNGDNELGDFIRKDARSMLFLTSRR